MPPSADAARRLRAFSRSLPMLLLRSHQAVMAEFRPILREHGITEQQWRVLRALTTAESLRVSRVGALTLISGPSLTRILKALDERGFVERRAEPGDQRAALISITPAGTKLIDTVAPTPNDGTARSPSGSGSGTSTRCTGCSRRCPTPARAAPRVRRRRGRPTRRNPSDAEDMRPSNPERAARPPQPTPSPIPDGHARAAESVLAALAASPGGLDEAEVARRLQRHGPNRLAQARQRSALRRLIGQF